MKNDFSREFTEFLFIEKQLQQEEQQVSEQKERERKDSVSLKALPARTVPTTPRELGTLDPKINCVTEPSSVMHKQERAGTPLLSLTSQVGGSGRLSGAE